MATARLYYALMNDDVNPYAGWHFSSGYTVVGFTEKRNRDYHVREYPYIFSSLTYKEVKKYISDDILNEMHYIVKYNNCNAIGQDVAAYNHMRFRDDYLKKIRAAPTYHVLAMLPFVNEYSI